MEGAHSPRHRVSVQATFCPRHDTHRILSRPPFPLPEQKGWVWARTLDVVLHQGDHPLAQLRQGLVFKSRRNPWDLAVKPARKERGQTWECSGGGRERGNADLTTPGTV